MYWRFAEIYAHQRLCDVVEYDLSSEEELNLPRWFAPNARRDRWMAAFEDGSVVELIEAIPIVESPYRAYWDTAGVHIIHE